MLPDYINRLLVRNRLQAFLFNCVKYDSLIYGWALSLVVFFYGISGRPRLGGPRTLTSSRPNDIGIGRSSQFHPEEHWSISARREPGIAMLTERVECEA
jgi:hypothetical protein